MLLLIISASISLVDPLCDVRQKGVIEHLEKLTFLERRLTPSDSNHPDWTRSKFHHFPVSFGKFERYADERGNRGRRFT
jgi:hypothetical protein